MSELRAALNFAYDNNWVTDDSAWRQALKPIQNGNLPLEGIGSKDSVGLQNALVRSRSLASAFKSYGRKINGRGSGWKQFKSVRN
jgi:hypothetical protein